MSPKKKIIDFASSFEELENITQWFDSTDNVDVEVGLKKFEHGLELASELKKKLSEVENKVEEIKKKFT
ncbi:exodeoxyribonuclease VII small subunit [Candidatus Uhrbacteria bacterium]|nr:exodeoxyribonuclease VII small subunit [Candidatus Uhrbacteria bacterium]